MSVSTTLDGLAPATRNEDRALYSQFDGDDKVRRIVLEHGRNETIFVFIPSTLPQECMTHNPLDDLSLHMSEPLDLIPLHQYAIVSRHGNHLSRL